MHGLTHGTYVRNANTQADSPHNANDDRIWDTRQGRQVGVLQQDDEALSCAIALQTGLLAVGVGWVLRLRACRS